MGTGVVNAPADDRPDEASEKSSALAEGSGPRPSGQEPEDGEPGKLSEAELQEPDDDPDRETFPRMLTDRYRLERLLAKGGMGRVYVATQLALERTVAIKVLVAPPLMKADFRRRFLLEASVSAKLSHPNIVVVHDYGESPEGDLFMAMELLEGRPLNQVLRDEGPFEPARGVGLTLQVARALRVAHKRGVAHRDLKPGNVFLERRTADDDQVVEVVKVLDFGLVKVFEDGRPSVERDVTQGDMMLGSPRYMSPEQIKCEAVDARSDIYSLGALLFAMVAGRPPFVGSSPIEILTQHLQRDPPSFQEVYEDLGYETPPFQFPPELEQLIRRCMQKRPEDRYQTIDEVISDLKHIQQEIGGTDFSDISASSPRVSDSSSFASARAHSDPGSGPSTPTDSGPFGGPLPIDVVEEGEPAPKSWRPLAAALVAAALLAGAAAFLLGGGDPPNEPNTEEAPSLRVPVTITSEPSGAEVMSGGVSLGATPVTRSMARTPEGARRVFELRLEGFETAQVSHPIDGASVEVHAVLAARPVPADPPDLAEDIETDVEPARDMQSMRPMRMQSTNTDTPTPSMSVSMSMAMSGTETMETDRVERTTMVRDIVVDDRRRVPIVD